MVAGTVGNLIGTFAVVEDMNCNIQNLARSYCLVCTDCPAS